MERLIRKIDRINSGVYGKVCTYRIFDKVAEKMNKLPNELFYKVIITTLFDDKQNRV